MKHGVQLGPKDMMILKDNLLAQQFL
jgi:hypothetical protein